MKAIEQYFHMELITLQVLRNILKAWLWNPSVQQNLHSSLQWYVCLGLPMICCSFFTSIFFLANISPVTTSKTEDLNNINAGMVSKSSLLCFCEFKINLKVISRGTYVQDLSQHGSQMQKFVTSKVVLLWSACCSWWVEWWKPVVAIDFDEVYISTLII